MPYYQTFVKDASFKANQPLTYAADQQLRVGSIVLVPLKQKLVLGFIVSEVDKPAFSTKSVHTIFDLPPLPKASLALAAWLLTYYPSSIGVTAQQFLPQRLSDKHQRLPAASRIRNTGTTLPALTDEQQQVIDSITKPDTYLLHGETGSGKTRIYIELAKRSLEQGHSVIILTPEIGLTPQLADSFREAFGNGLVIVTHSQLTEKKRRDLWLNALFADKPLVVIGPRSALFMPLANVGLIILDEFHEPTYKQDQLPHYHASKVAAKLAELHKATLILGSGTPSIVDYFTALTKHKPILRMEKLARTTAHHNFTLNTVDIKQRSNFARSTHLSDTLLSAVERSLVNHEQSLLFLNRRGTARSVLCENCGWQAICPHCNLPLTYHGDLHIFQCHTCGTKQRAAAICPECSNTNIILKNIGTKAIVDEITSIFPHSRVMRFDADNKKYERLEQQYSDILAGKIDILVGTQVLAKGLDLPKLSTVGIVLADSSLSFPDYTSGERTYQLLRQVIGRVGRGHRSSTVVVQTYNPRGAILQTATNNNWASFYEYELAQRQQFLFPPFCFLLKLSCRRATPSACEQAAQKLLAKLQVSRLRVIIDGPSPSFHEKIGHLYEWQLVVKAKSRGELLRVISLLPSGWSYDIDPLHLL